MKRAAREAMVGAARRQTTMTYTELLQSIGRPEGFDNLAGLLREISMAEEAAGRGLLSAVVVRAPGGLPGGGFFQLAASLGRDTADRQACWRAEHEHVVLAHRGP